MQLDISITTEMKGITTSSSYIIVIRLAFLHKQTLITFFLMTLLAVVELEKEWSPFLVAWHPFPGNPQLMQLPFCSDQWIQGFRSSTLPRVFCRLKLKNRIMFLVYQPWQRDNRHLNRHQVHVLQTKDRRGTPIKGGESDASRNQVLRWGELSVMVDERVAVAMGLNTAT